MNFDNVFKSMERTTVEVFSEHDSASVQATLYIMAGKILEDNKVLEKVTYKLPNKVRFYLTSHRSYSSTDVTEIFV